MAQAIRAVSYVNLVAFVALAVVALRQWRTQRDAAAAWAALAFGSLGFVVLVARLVPEHPHGLGAGALQRILIGALLVFPYLLFRFTIAFRPPALPLARALGAMTAVLLVWTFALPRFPAAGDPRPGWYVAWLVAFLVHWTVLTVVSSVRLWRAGRRLPTVAGRRMRLLAVAGAAITVAIFGAVASSDSDSTLALVVQLLATISALAFLTGLSPPAILRVAWRRPEQLRVQAAIEDLMTLATSQEEIAARVLEPVAAIVGARAVEIRNEEGRVVGAHGRPGAADARIEVPLAGGGALTAWTTPYAPFFGDEEIALLRTLGALTGLALDRVRLFEQEREARIALERANEVKENFVALAAHELRTPVTTIHGFVRTLNHWPIGSTRPSGGSSGISSSVRRSGWRRSSSSYSISRVSTPTASRSFPSA